ncbi:hypothetical protein V5740_00270 [Croceibacterium sp. TMG7-5b_MA50]|uniref:hypothetical protein n=1 Tax=Croceibacterium sp. TMG7-5b_MA50 TaxID=3121290 RepID=UPI0032218199
MRQWPLLAALLLGACATSQAPAPVENAPMPTPATSPPPASVAGPGTRIIDRAAADRLLAADGATLQWISWDRRGTVRVVEQGGTIRLDAAQDQPAGPGRLSVSGVVREIGSDYFILDGTIRITDAPDPGRRCEADKLWHFAVTQNRPYWRLREFEWCDGLTDYVDIYMAGTG